MALCAATNDKGVGLCILDARVPWYAMMASAAAIRTQLVGAHRCRCRRLQLHMLNLACRPNSTETRKNRDGTQKSHEWLRAIGLVTSSTFCTALLCQYLQDSDADVDYGDVHYWQARYEQEWYRQPHDWLGNFESLKPWLGAMAEKKRIVHLGCGTSLLAENMADAGVSGEIWNVDVSESCVKAMQSRDHKHSARLHWVTGDVRDMRDVFEDGFFDCAIDKSTLDSVCDCKRDADAALYVAEVARILNESGVFVVFSFSPPAARLHHLQKAFQCDVQLAEGQCFVYTCCKSKTRS